MSKIFLHYIYCLLSYFLMYKLNGNYLNDYIIQTFIHTYLLITHLLTCMLYYKTAGTSKPRVFL